jgi:cytochrome b involved in lipid metabolism
VIDEGVYNLSKMVEKHPGGPKVISLRAGKKADKAFASGDHPPKVIDKTLPHYRVGTIDEQSQI